jgi:hypothetical protein
MESDRWWLLRIILVTEQLKLVDAALMYSLMREIESRVDLDNILRNSMKGAACTFVTCFLVSSANTGTDLQMYFFSF